MRGCIDLAATASDAAIAVDRHLSGRAGTWDEDKIAAFAQQLEEIEQSRSPLYTGVLSDTFDIMEGDVQQLYDHLVSLKRDLYEIQEKPEEVQIRVRTQCLAFSRASLGHSRQYSGFA